VSCPGRLGQAPPSPHCPPCECLGPRRCPIQPAYVRSPGFTAFLSAAAGAVLAGAATAGASSSSRANGFDSTASVMLPGGAAVGELGSPRQIACARRLHVEVKKGVQPPRAARYAGATPGAASSQRAAGQGVVPVLAARAGRRTPFSKPLRYSRDRPWPPGSPPARNGLDRKAAHALGAQLTPRGPVRSGDRPRRALRHALGGRERPGSAAA